MPRYGNARRVKSCPRYSSGLRRERGQAINPLMAGLFDWGKKNGWKWLNLGTAPLAAPKVRDNPALAEALRHLPYTHREHFDSTLALREFKESFRPVWEPRFIAIPPGVSSEEAVEEVNRLTTRIS